MAGGSGLYIDALCNGLDDFPEADPALRAHLSERLRTEGVSALRSELRILDPESYATVDPANGQRIIRALEVTIATGRKYSSLKTRPARQRPFAIEKTGLTRPRAELYARIDARVDQMMEEGLLEEARNLLPLRDLPALNTVGYKELFGYFDGAYDLSEAVRLIKRNTRHYAKKQLTWWARDPSIRWIDLSA
jgi:tRNA dimethylallyltransferase